MPDRGAIEQRVRSENPFFPVSEGSASWTISPDEFPEEYEAMVQDRVDMGMEAAKQAEDQEAQRQQRSALIAAMRSGRATPQQMQEAVALLLDKI